MINVCVCVAIVDDDIGLIPVHVFNLFSAFWTNNAVYIDALTAILAKLLLCQTDAAIGTNFGVVWNRRSTSFTIHIYRSFLPLVGGLEFHNHITARIWAIVNIETTIYLEFSTGKVVVITIRYDRLWETMKRKGITLYRLIKEFQISTGQLDRLRKNESLSTHTLNELCRILDCRIEDIAEYFSDEK